LICVYENSYEKELYNSKTKSNDSLLNAKYNLNYLGSKIIKLMNNNSEKYILRLYSKESA